ncbi:MAG: hypothetical protein AAF242_12690 [Bacteroidota bacterium]
MAGTTAIAFFNQNGKVSVRISEKKKDADQWMLKQLEELRLQTLFWDAPLSLPGVYTQPELYNDYFYRASDKALSAMSPMFLGGLTARAMRLQTMLPNTVLQVFEVYPGFLAKVLGLAKKLYKKDNAYLPIFSQQLENDFEFKIENDLQNWHQFDALLALCTGLRYLKNEHQVYGDLEEGAIIV